MISHGHQILYHHSYFTFKELLTLVEVRCNSTHHHHKHQGLDPLIRSASKVTAALSNISLVFQLFSFLVVCSSMISKGFSFVASLASV